MRSRGGEIGAAGRADCVRQRTELLAPFFSPCAATPAALSAYSTAKLKAGMEKGLSKENCRFPLAARLPGLPWPRRPGWGREPAPCASETTRAEAAGRLTPSLAPA